MVCVNALNYWSRGLQVSIGVHTVASCALTWQSLEPETRVLESVKTSEVIMRCRGGV